jgi:class 3 adenylate cyclase
MQVRLMSSQGGDVFKFAGDAVLVLWPPGTDEDLTTLTRRAAQCGLEIQRGLHEATLAPGITLSIKIGVGVGEVAILHVGGVFGRMEYVATGAPLVQAFKAEHQAQPRDVIVSPEASVQSLSKSVHREHIDSTVSFIPSGLDCLIPPDGPSSLHISLVNLAALTVIS